MHVHRNILALNYDVKRAVHHLTENRSRAWRYGWDLSAILQFLFLEDAPSDILNIQSNLIDQLG